MLSVWHSSLTLLFILLFIRFAHGCCKATKFILAALLAATFANAQISLEHQFNGDIRFGTGIQLIDHCFAYSGTTRVFGAYFCDVQDNFVTIYDAFDYSVVKTINVPANSFVGLISKGIFTTDGEMGLCIISTDHRANWSRLESLLLLYESSRWGWECPY